MHPYRQHNLFASEIATGKNKNFLNIQTDKFSVLMCDQPII